MSRPTIRSPITALLAKRASPSPVWRTLGRIGWTLVEMILVLGIFGTLVAIMQPMFNEYLYSARVAKAIGDIEAIQADLSGHELLGSGLPEDLGEIGWGAHLDPWGNAYQYLKFTPTNTGAQRKDRFLVPLNSTYDLYSMGEDGKSASALTAKTSMDDVVRANDGAFIGLGAKY